MPLASAPSTPPVRDASDSSTARGSGPSSYSLLPLQAAAGPAVLPSLGGDSASAISVGLGLKSKSLDAPLEGSHFLGAGPDLSQPKGPGEDLSASASSAQVDEPVAPYMTDSWHSRYVRPLPAVSVKDTPSCQGVLPPFVYDSPPDGPEAPVASYDDLKASGGRALVFWARFGLGNTLRGWASAYVFAMLTGRKLVRFHGGPHRQVLDALCAAFECQFDAIRNVSNHRTFFRAFPGARHVASNVFNRPDIVNSMMDKTPVVYVSTGAYFDHFWRENPALQQCVLDALHCTSIWCVHSHAVFALLGGGPTRQTAATIARVLRRSGGAGKEVAAAAPAASGVEVASGGPAGAVLITEENAPRLRFDVGIQIRTQPKAIERHAHVSAAMCQAVTSAELAACVAQKDAAAAEDARQLQRQFLDNSNIWDCLRAYLGHRSQEKGARLSIFLATDNAVLRRSFVDMLAPYGTTYYSAGEIMHTSKGGSAAATLGEFFLMSKADVILEVRTSTFVESAALLGNSTLYVPKKGFIDETCSWVVPHAATVV